MIIGVVRYRMTSLHHLFEHLGMLVDILADHEERGLHAVVLQNRQNFRRHLRYRPVIEGEINSLTRTEHTVRVKTLEYRFEDYQAKLDAPKMAASESLRTEIETGILPFHIGIRFASKASRIGSIIQ